MESTVGQRLGLLLKRNNITNRDFSSHVSVKEKQVSNWVKGVSDIKVDHVVEIKNFFKTLNLNWFITGQGGMFIDEDGYIPVAAEDDVVPYQTKCKNCAKMEGKVDLLKDMLMSRQDECHQLKNELNNLRSSIEDGDIDNKKNRTA